MKEAVFALMTLCFLAGCAETGGQKSPAKAKKQGFKGLPVELQVQDDEAIPVRVEAKDKGGIPVRVQWQEDNGKPVKVEVKTDKALPVKLDLHGKEAFPVAMKITRKTLILSLIPVVVSLIAAIGACIAGIGACWSAQRTKKAAEGRLFFEQLQVYASREMRDYLRMLFKWDREVVGKDKSQRDEKAEEWVKALFDKNHEKHKDADDLDVARRHITHYFLNIHQLCESGYVKERFLKEICQSVGTAVLYINFPLEKALIEYLDKRDKIPGKGEENIGKLKKKFDELKRLSENARYRI